MSPDLTSQKCEACTIDAPKVTEEESLELLKTLDKWVILNEGFDYLEKIFTFDNYEKAVAFSNDCLLYTSPSPRDLSTSRMPSSA